MNIFIPKMYKKDIFDIDYNKLKENNYKLIIFDLDNTIGKIKQKECDLKTSNLLTKLSKDFIVIVASNSLKKRVDTFLKDISIDRFSFSLKPSSRVLKKIKKKYNVEYKDIVIIGDQLLTDILLGNRFNLYTILVDKLDRYDLKKTKVNRFFENIIKKKNKFKEGEYY